MSVYAGDPGAGAASSRRFRGRSPARAALIAVLKAYRLVISPLYGSVCKFYPSCSAYALRAVEVHGAARGGWLAVRRLGRCHPWSHGGYDPVPGTPEYDAERAEQGGTTSSAASTAGGHDSPAAQPWPTSTRGAVRAGPSPSPRGGL